MTAGSTQPRRQLFARPFAFGGRLGAGGGDVELISPRLDIRFAGELVPAVAPARKPST
jgi:hypothetical protein